MIIVRSMHADYRSNAYLVADEPGGTAIFIDSGAPLEPLLDAVAEHNLTVTHLLTTHEHHDHTLNNAVIEERFDLAVMDTERLLAAGTLSTGGLSITVLSTPGHVAEHASILVNGTDCFTGDVLFQGTVGGTFGGGPDGYAQLRSSIMDTLLSLGDDVRIHPGHAAPSSIGEERANNPFIRYWLEGNAPVHEPARVYDHDATLLVWARDYDDGYKALVEFADGRTAIVGGSSVHRTTPA